MEFWGLHLSSSGPTLLSLKNITAHVTKAVLVGKDATEADRVHVCYRDKSGHKFILCVLRNSIGHDQATLDVKLTNTVGCSLFLQVHNSATRSVNPDVKVVLTGYCTQNSPKDTPRGNGNVAQPVSSVANAPPPSPGNVSVASNAPPPYPARDPPQTPPVSTQKRRRDPDTEKALEEFTALRQTMFGANGVVEGEGPDDTDYDEGDMVDWDEMGSGFEGDEGDEGEGEDLDEEELIRLGFTPVANSSTPTSTSTTSTTTTTTTTLASKPQPTTTPATKTPAKNNNVTPSSKPPPQASKTSVESKTPAADNDKPRLSKRQKKKLRAEENEKKEGGSAPPQSQRKGPVTLPSGLQYEDTLVGKGAVATKGNRLQMRYKGSLATGQVFDSNMPRGRPFSFKLGAGEVIRGWDEGLQGMRVGGKRTLKIPSALGYGSRGAGPKIPPNANLTFEVELISKS